MCECCNFSFLGMGGFAREIGRAQLTLADITGQLPRLFRAPAGLRNPFLAPVLLRLDLQLVSWTRRGFDTVQRQPMRVLGRLTKGLSAGDILLLHDGNAAHAPNGQPVVLQVLPELLKRFQQNGLRAVTLPEAVLEQYPQAALPPPEGVESSGKATLTQEYRG